MKTFKVGDNVKKRIYVGYQFPGEKHFQQCEFAFGKIVFIERDRAYVRYKDSTMEGYEKLTDLFHMQ